MRARFVQIPSLIVRIGFSSPAPLEAQVGGPVRAVAALYDHRLGVLVPDRHVGPLTVTSSIRSLPARKEQHLAGLNLVCAGEQRFKGSCDYLAEASDGTQKPMLNVFHRDGQTVRHFWGSELFYASLTGCEPGITSSARCPW
jgi:hypothetical protein